MAARTSKPVQPASATRSPKGGSLAWLNPAKWLEVIAGVVTGSLPSAPKEHVAFIVISFLGVAVAILGSTVLIWKGVYFFGGTLCVIGLVFLAFGMWCVRQCVRPKGPISTLGNHPDLTRKSPTGGWSRVTVKVPEESKKQNELEEQVRTVRALAKKGYSDVLEGRRSPPSQKDPDSVRVNVFLPDTQKVLPDEVCTLFIPDWLHDGMMNDEEKGIRFRWDEGVTGQVFARERPIGTRRTSATGEWEWIPLEGMGGRADHKFQLTQVQMCQIDEKLRWIVSFPLKVDVTDKQQHTAGVLNVDGLSEVLSPEEMQTIYNKLKPAVEHFAKDLAGLDKCRITITVEDIAAQAATSTG